VSTRGSRIASARGSRKGSRVGLMTPMGVRTPGEDDGVAGEDYFTNVGVDFADVVGMGDLEEEEDGEMRRLVWGRAAGWVDWAVGWMEDEGRGEGDENQEEGNEEKGEGKKKRRKRREGDMPHVQRREAEGEGNIDVPPAAGDGGWRDAAWLLGVAKKIIV
jgi:hypothetical protein